jgi:hypothetical protein
MNSGHQGRCGFSAPADHAYFVPIALGSEPLIPFPAIGDHDGFWLNGILHKRSKAAGGSILDATQSDPPDPVSVYLGCDHHESLVSEVSAPFTRLHSAYVGFVYFNLASEAVSTRSNHGSSEFMQTSPSRLVASKAEQPLEPQGTDPLFLIRNPPDSSEPCSKRKMATMEDCTCKRRSLITAIRALPQPALQRPILYAAATRAVKAIRPSQLKYVGSAVLLTRKPFFEFSERLREVAHTFGILAQSPSRVK